uniref:Uncharacterized protein n=1 Tax=Onchocerca volvulus TaxID=6282 RepID=A0A8R1XLC5_ONCVO
MLGLISISIEGFQEDQSLLCMAAIDKNSTNQNFIKRNIYGHQPSINKYNINQHLKDMLTQSRACIIKFTYIYMIGIID